MKRRKALQSLVIISAGVSFLPSCHPGSVPGYANIPISFSQKGTIESLASSILPFKADMPAETPETPVEFILTMMNDCNSPEQISTYMDGLEAFETLIQSQYKKNFSLLDDNEKDELILSIEELKGQEISAKRFYQKTRRYAIQHFTGSEYYMTHFRDFEFAPGRFIGCVSI